MPLKLSLKPGEAVVVNGAVIRNGERRGTLLLETKARILRERDIIFPDRIRTQAEAAYFAVMQLYLTGETDGAVFDTCIAALADLMEEAPDQASRDKVLDITRAVAAGQIYRGLGAFRKLGLMETGGGAHVS
ncbi:flagellar biosynthesis repressor FlbT [Henriciella aquimarina]|uniref:flagellar biosynthesis repressor FlbT n=1 Tax=Henriciella aquimarina TaxID=545261 RepID=UPI000A05FD09|nr:flagellar biosynthesis repressor FlbT [Henriciella aquimarina]